MKKVIVLSSLLTFTSCFIGKVYCQERQDEAREKVDFVVEAKSDKISKVTGWSLNEKKSGKVWEESNTLTGYNYQVGRPLDIAFKSLKIYQLTTNGNKLYALAVTRPVLTTTDGMDYSYNAYYGIDSIVFIGSKVDYFFFSESGMLQLQNIVNAADGKSYHAASVRYYKAGQSSQNWYDPKITVKSKELKAILQSGQVTIEDYGNRCEGDSLFVISSQILKGDTIVRFNVLADVSGSGSQFEILPVINSYYELTKSDFGRLFKFTPYVTKENMQKANDLISSGDKKVNQKDYAGAISDYSKALKIDADNAETYCKRGLSKKEFKDYKGAIEDCSKAIEIEPEGAYYYSRALAKIASGQKESGCTDLKKADELGYKKAANTIKLNCK